MPFSQFITFISWSFASSLLLTFVIIATIVFRNNRQKVFQFYALYCFLVLLYCLTKIPDFFYTYQVVSAWKSNIMYQSFYWYIQVLFHNAYLSFGIHFLNLKAIAPLLTKRILIFQQTVILIFGVMTLLVLVGMLQPQILVWGYSYLYIELHIIVCFFIIYSVRKSHQIFRNYFVIGSLIYMVMILFSFVLSALKISLGSINPPAIFYAAITIECSFFSAGLGIRIRDVYRQKMKYQTDLNLALQKVQAQLSLQLEQQNLVAENVDLNSQVLRGQMNSHFIFNVLTSIKFFVRNKETEKAIFYLGKFSRFIRSVLNGSIYEKSSLEQELRTIELYLNIEQMRFDDDLHYSISVKEGLTISLIPFPAMLLQPFVENALWHGLHLKEGDKKIQITVAGAPNHLIISIVDNGVGNAAIRNSPLVKDGKDSHGLKIVQRRIALFNKTNADIKLSYDITHHEKGTEVNLTMLFGKKKFS